MPTSRSRIPLYASLVAIALLVGGFGLIADEMSEGDTLSFDRAVLMLFRSSGDPTLPAGPGWLPEAMRDVTSLGSFVVLGLLVVLIALFLIMSRRVRTALFLVVAVVSGSILSTVLKTMFNRPRPDLTGIAKVFTASFPSGHATVSAVVYLTLGALLAGTAESRPLRIFFVSAAVLLTLIVGISRLYLGVHYPTDVAAGWALGAAWAILCWVAYRVLVGPPKSVLDAD